MEQKEQALDEAAYETSGGIGEMVSLLLTAYLFIIFCMYPFYMQNGYMEIGSVKFHFYKVITFGGFALILPLAAICAKKRRLWFSFTDWAVLAYGGSVVLSYLCSDFKSEALWGEDGWYMGLVTQLLFVLSYFLVSRFWEYEGKLLLAFLAAATGVFVLGLLHRFSIYPFEIQGANISFLSTLGNINWYCGYWSVLFPVGPTLYWCGEKLWIRFCGLAGAAVAIATGVSQGSASAFIVFAGVYLFLFCLSFRDEIRMKRFLELAMLFCLVCQGLRLWRKISPLAFNYYEGTLCDRMTKSSITFYGFLVLLILYICFCLLGKKGKIHFKRLKVLRQIVLLLVVIGSGVYVLLLVLNSNIEEGIRSMGDMSPFVFDLLWGSSRGGTWSAGAEIYENMPVLRRLVGAGPDCFRLYLSTLPDLAERVKKQFDGARLTNAHNEWLTVLVNNGVLGLISYAGIFVCSTARFVFRAGRDFGTRKRYLYLFAMSAFAYTIHNVVSFQQILSTPFVFLMLGMGESLMRAPSEDNTDDITNTDHEQIYLDEY